MQFTEMMKSNLIISPWESLILFLSDFRYFFHFSYIFAKIGPQSAEKLATRIASVMAAHPLNRYVFFIQQADADRSLKSYRVFRKALSARVHFLKVDCVSAVWNADAFQVQADASQVQADASQMQADALAFPFSYEIWEG